MRYAWSCDQCGKGWDFAAVCAVDAGRHALALHDSHSPDCPYEPRVVPASEAPAQDGKPEHDPVDHPKHYTAHPSGVECIAVTEHMNFNVGNAVKYLWRHGDKGNPVEDLKKARWYVDREIQRLEREAKP